MIRASAWVAIAFIVTQVGCSKENTVETEGDTIYQVSPEGGWVRGPGVDLFFKDGTIAEDLSITIKEVEAESVNGGDLTDRGPDLSPSTETRTLVSPVFELGPKSRQFALPVTLVVDQDGSAPAVALRVISSDGETGWRTHVPVANAGTAAIEISEFAPYFAVVAIQNLECNAVEEPEGCWPAGSFCACGEQGGSVVGTWRLDVDQSCETIDEPWCEGVQRLSVDNETASDRVTINADNTWSMDLDNRQTRTYACASTQEVPCDEDYCCEANDGGQFECVTHDQFSGEDLVWERVDESTINLGDVAGQRIFCVEGDTMRMYDAEGELLVFVRE